MNLERLCVGVALALSTTSVGAQQAFDDAEFQVPLWPGPSTATSQRVVASVPLQDGSPDRYIEGITRPYLAVYPAKHPNGTALLVIPGGGYQRVVIDKEGRTLAPVFADAVGITLFVLRYRLPADAGRDAPLADAQRALRLIRGCAPKWQLAPDRIGALGFSAGGHVAASLATRFDEAVYPLRDAIDQVSARPDMLLLGYPVITMQGDAVHAGSRKQLLGDTPSAAQLRAYSLQDRVHRDMPATFLFHAADDASVPPQNSLLFAGALQVTGVPVELHLFPRGGHGFGVHALAGERIATWPRLAIEWIKSQPKPKASTRTQLPASLCPDLLEAQPE